MTDRHNYYCFIILLRKSAVYKLWPAAFRAKTGFEALLDFDADTEMQKLRQQKKRAAELQEYYELSADVSICKAKADVANAKLNAFLTAHPWLIDSVNVPLLAKEEPPCPT